MRLEFSIQRVSGEKKGKGISKGEEVHENGSIQSGGFGKRVVERRKNETE